MEERWRPELKGRPGENFSVVNTYTPNLGYPTDTSGKYWAYVEAYISFLPNNIVRIRRADNNRQLCGNDTNHNHIWKLALGNLETRVSDISIKVAKPMSGRHVSHSPPKKP